MYMLQKLKHQLKILEARYSLYYECNMNNSSIFFVTSYLHLL